VIEPSSALHARWWLGPAVLGGLLLAATVTISPTAAQTPATPTTGLPSPTSEAGAAANVDGISQTETVSVNGGGGGGSNVVLLRNSQDGGLRIRGNIDLSRINGPRVGPRNLASAAASCADCQTLVVALQLNLYERTAPWVRPENAAVAVNAGCTRCYTVARAIQYALPVDDPMATPAEVAELIRQLDRELQEIHADKTISLAAAEARIDAVVARFVTLANGLDQKRMEATDSTSVTPTPTDMPTPAAAGSPAAARGTSASPASTGQPTGTPTSASASTSTSVPAPSPTPAP
jgi:putative peptide zinc metalloprotease protein